MSLRDDFVARFPEISAETVDTYLPIYETRYKVYYNAEYGQNSSDDEIILNLLAHLITTASNTQTDNAPNKAVTSESVGGVSVSYASPSDFTTKDEFFSSTIYGQTFLMLTKINNNGAYFV